MTAFTMGSRLRGSYPTAGRAERGCAWSPSSRAEPSSPCGVRCGASSRRQPGRS